TKLVGIGVGGDGEWCRAVLVSGGVGKKAGKLDINRGEGIDTDVSRRSDVVRMLQDIKKTKAMEVAQKAKIKWVVEGDENSKYYHGVINNKKNNLAIRGVLVDGNWVESPQLVKNELYAHFKQRFEKPNLSGIQFDREFPNKICSDQAVDLEQEVSKEEAVKWFFLHERIPSEGNSSFITLIPKVSNANMGKDFRSISLIGSVYKIIAKILVNHLILVLGDLVSDTQSALLKERQILDGPFILNEVIQWCKKKKKQSMIFKVDFEKAYDSVSASGLRINMKKSKLMRIAVDASRVDQAIRQIGCMSLKMPFKYLGSVVGDRMSRVKSWNDVINALVTRLSRWKLKTISIEGRLTLLKSVLGSTPIFHTSIYKVPMVVLRTMEGIRARFFNGADNKVRKSSWAKVITAIHGDDGKIGKTVNPTFPSIWLNIIQEVVVMKTKEGGDVAFNILAPRIYMLESMKDIQVATKLSHVDLEWSFRRKSRGGAEQIQMTILKEMLEGCILSDMKDRWTWSLEGSGISQIFLFEKLLMLLSCRVTLVLFLRFIQSAHVQDFKVVGFGISGD
nr:RNA-directed DNA polymerase, eukaryota, reverse transcriptase zinc-binding domain protein [Tanacetum cinerariifolium]